MNPPTILRSYSKCALLCAVALFALNCVQHANAYTAFEYSAGTNNVPGPAPNPSDSGGGSFTFAGDTNLVEGGLSPDPTSNPGNLNAWSIKDTNASAVYYEHQLAQADLDAIRGSPGSGWKMSFLLRTEDLGYGTDTAFIQAWNFSPSSVASQRFRYILTVKKNTDGTLLVSGATGGTGGNTFAYTVTNTTQAAGYNLIEVCKHNFMAIAPLTSERRVDVYVNGQFAKRWSGGNVGTSSTTVDTYWGTDTTQKGQALVNLYRFEVFDAAPPTILTNPVPATNVVGGTVSFSCAAGPTVLGMIWYKDGNLVPNQPTPGNSFDDTAYGAFSSPYSLTITNVAPSDIGDYTCVVTNQWGTSTSAPAHLYLLGDYTPPTVIGTSASAAASRVRVHYSEKMDSVSTTQTANYAFQSGALSVAAVTMPDAYSADIATTTQPVPGSNYVLEVANVMDQSSNSIALTNLSVAVGTNFPAMPNLVAAFNDTSAATNAYGGYTWRDLSGNENDAVNPSLNQRPSLVPNALQGHGVFHWDPPSVQNLFINGSTSTLLNQDNITWFVVARCTNIGSGGSGAFVNQAPHVFSYVPSPTIGEWNCYFSRGDASTGNQFCTVTSGRDFSGTEVGAEPFPVSNGTWYILEGHVDPGVVYGRVLDPALNTVMAATNSSVSGMAIGTGIPVDLWFGVAPNYQYRFGGDMAEVLLYTGAMSQSDLDAAENYLRTKYFPPSLSARLNGADVEITFTGVLQSSASPGTGYTDVGGSPTSPYIITPGMQAAQPALYFRCRIP
jgi:hypothetical protein